MVGLGAQVQRGDPLCVLHAADEDSAEAAAHAVLRAMTIGKTKEIPDLIIERIDP